MAYEFTGQVKRIGEVQEFGNNGFTKRELVVESGGEYPQPVPFELVKDKCALADSLSEGDTVTIKFDLRGRYYEAGDRYFPSITAWHVKAEAAGDPPAFVEDQIQDQQQPF